jgi:cytidine deaminase
VAGGDAAGGTLSGEAVCTPCGGCRQAILEASHLGGRDIEIVSASGDGTRIEAVRISGLLPFGFGPANLSDSA